MGLGAAFNKPVVITARGSDVTELPRYAGPRRMIRWAMRRAAALISVSGGLRAALIELGAASDAVTVLRYGVDLRVFRPVDRASAREALAVEGPTLLSVGHLIPRKGHDLVIRALPDLPDWRLLIVGEGPERARLEGIAGALGVADRVRLLGALPHASLPGIYSEGDVLVLASIREGWANVLLEAMACGTPAVASNIPGNPEVVQSHAAGVIVESNTPEGFAAGVRRLVSERPGRDATRRYAEDFSWDATSEGQLAIFRRVLRRTETAV